MEKNNIFIKRRHSSFYALLCVLPAKKFFDSACFTGEISLVLGKMCYIPSSFFQLFSSLWGRMWGLDRNRWFMKAPKLGKERKIAEHLQCVSIMESLINIFFFSLAALCFFSLLACLLHQTRFSLIFFFRR